MFVWDKQQIYNVIHSHARMFCRMFFLKPSVESGQDGTGANGDVSQMKNAGRGRHFIIDRDYLFQYNLRNMHGMAVV